MQKSGKFIDKTYDTALKTSSRLTSMFITKNMEDISAYVSVRIRHDKWIYINDGELEFIEYWKIKCQKK